MPGLQKKTINKYINNRINFWVWSLKDPDILNTLGITSTNEIDKYTDEDKKAVSEFQSKIHDGTIVTGGAIASMLLGEEVNDIDIYFNNQDVARLVAQYYIQQMIQTGNLKETWAVRKIDVIDCNHDGVQIYLKSQGVSGEAIRSEEYSYFEQQTENDIDQFFNDYVKNMKKDDAPKHTVQFMTSNAITLANGIQLILRFTGNPDAIHENFDFVHATNYWTRESGVVYNTAALEAILERRLYYIGSKFPVSTIFRFRKFIERGWRVSAGEMMKVAWDVSNLDLNDVSVLRDQTIGMDSAYFGEVINLLKDRESVDRTYLFKCINQIFNDGEEELQEN